MKKALVTGGCGFIGSHLVKNLVDNDWQVTVVDDLSSGSLDNLYEKVKFRSVIPGMIDAFLSSVLLEKNEVFVITGDFSDGWVLNHIKDHGYTHIFHLAANPRVEFSVQYPATTNHVNVQKTIELLTSCKYAKIEKFVFASSSAVYGDITEIPTPEGSDKKPNSPYGLQKLIVEQYLSLFEKLYGLNSVSLRFANVYGPNSDGSSPYSTAVGAWCQRLKSNKPLRSDGDGNQSRDMIYVKDVAEALRYFGSHPFISGSVPLNIGTGTSISNNEILEKIKERVGTFEIENAPPRPGDVKKTQLDVSKVSELGWTPKFNFDLGLEETMKWWELG